MPDIIQCIWETMNIKIVTVNRVTAIGALNLNELVNIQYTQPFKYQLGLHGIFVSLHITILTVAHNNDVDHNLMTLIWITVTLMG